MSHSLLQLLKHTCLLHPALTPHLTVLAHGLPCLQHQSQRIHTHITTKAHSVRSHFIDIQHPELTMLAHAVQHAVPYHMMMPPPPPNVNPQHPYESGPAPPVQMGGHA